MDVTEVRLLRSESQSWRKDSSRFQDEEEEIKLEVNVLKKVSVLLLPLLGSALIDLI